MFSFFKKNKDKIEVPAWASFFTESQYNVFIDAVNEYLYAKNVTFVINDGTLEAGPNDLGLTKMGLLNVAQLCKLENRDYKEIVREHFDSLERAMRFDKEFQEKIDDYEQVKEFIGVRLYPADYTAPVGKESLIGKDFAGEIYALVIFDLPETIKTIKPEQAEKWGKTAEELFETGITNIRAKYQPVISKQQFGEFSIWFAQGDHFFTPNMVFDFELMQKLAGLNGALVGIPHRHSVIIHPIENIKTVEFITGLIQTVNGMYNEGPGSISNNIFWYKDGLFTNLPYEIESDKIQFYPPEKFIEMLNSLQTEE